MADFATQRKFRKAQEALFTPSVGADHVIIFKGYEELTFAVKTHGVPVLKNEESIEFSTTHGVKTVRDGYMQTLNTIQVSFMEDENDRVMDIIDNIRLGGRNGDVEISFFKGRTIENMKFLGILESSVLSLSEPIEGDSENATTSSNLQVEIKGHWYPKSAGAKEEVFTTTMGGLV